MFINSAPHRTVNVPDSHGEDAAVALTLHFCVYVLARFVAGAVCLTRGCG